MILVQKKAFMPLYIKQSGDLDRCRGCLTDWLTTLKDSATQLLINYKIGALVTQKWVKMFTFAYGQGQGGWLWNIQFFDDSPRHKWRGGWIWVLREASEGLKDPNHLLICAHIGIWGRPTKYNFKYSRKGQEEAGPRLKFWGRPRGDWRRHWGAGRQAAAGRPMATKLRGNPLLRGNLFF